MPDNFILRDGSVTPVTPSDNMVWALSHGHLLLFKHELTKSRGVAKVQTYATLWIYLRYISPEFIKNDMAYGLVRWLSWMLVRLRMKHPAKRQLLLRLSVFDGSFMEVLRTAIDLSDVYAVVVLLSRDDLEISQLASLGEALVDLAVSFGNDPLLNLLMQEKFAADATGMLFKIVTSGMPERVVARFAQHLLQRGDIHLYSFSDSVSYLVFQVPLAVLGRHGIPKQLSLQPWGDLEGCRHKVDRLLHKACLRGDLPMVEMMISIGCDTNACTDGGSCLDVALYGISQDRLEILWHLLMSSALPSFATLCRVVILRQWAFVLYLLQFNISFKDSSPLQDNRVAPTFKIAVDDLDDIDYPFLGRIPTGDQHEHNITDLSPLAFLQSNSWDDWNFYFVPYFRRDNGWKSMAISDEKLLCKNIIDIISSKGIPKEKRRDTVVRDSSVPETPKTMQSSIEFDHSRPDLGPWIKLTIPNTFSIIAEISTRWRWLPSWNVAMSDPSWKLAENKELLHTMWDDSGRLNSLALWTMRRTVHTLEKRHHNYGRVHDRLSDAAWAIKGLQKSYHLLQNLPSGSKFHVIEDELPFTELARFRELDVPYVQAYSFGFAYTSVRIMWLRTLGLLSVKGLLSKVRIHTVTLQATMLPLEIGLPEHGVSTSVFMPGVLEAAFLGTESKHILQDIIASHPPWVLEVAAWIKTMDPGIFTWSMGQDSPLCFRRAFQSFRDIGTSERDMNRLEEALDMSRGRISELE
ncbi:heterokaryon incompatibility protein het-E-1 [Fusarium pseudocircinatum]|uniref:Heterokaryon incompatibility protein het-E-1 n=1 Tax=Fusarium pseudocircinatum TaxID=56676 RepID=A0A8H5PUF4_9HYPO|nr:heterokaryon incompatibility protein het-E-1 [Fusarium pseudocircinatum]